MKHRGGLGCEINICDTKWWEYDTTYLSKCIELYGTKSEPNVCRLKKNYLGDQGIPGWEVDRLWQNNLTVTNAWNNFTEGAEQEKVLT